MFEIFFEYLVGFIKCFKFYKKYLNSWSIYDISVNYDYIFGLPISSYKAFIISILC